MQSLTAFLFAIILALALAPAPQSQRKPSPEEEKECGTVIPPEQIKAELARDAELARKNVAPQAMAPSTDAPYYLPLTIHMVRDSEGIQTGLSPQNLEKVMQSLNQLWAQVGIQFFIYGEIDEIFNDEFLSLPNTEAKRDELRNVNNVPNTINVYFTNLQGNIGGVGSFTNDNTQGILLDYQTMNEFSAGLFRLEVFAHEMGHFFDLYHTHETKFGVECPSGSNCTSAGDKLCDTSADPQLNQHGFVDNDCNYTGPTAAPAGCGDTPYQPPTRNLMTYSKYFCRAEFTPNQISKVLYTLHNASNRKNLIDGWKFYVDPQASSSNTKCTSTAPCRTVEKAVQAAQSGSVIYLKPGAHKTSSLGGKRLTFRRWGSSGVAELKP